MRRKASPLSLPCGSTERGDFVIKADLGSSGYRAEPFIRHPEAPARHQWQIVDTGAGLTPVPGVFAPPLWAPDVPMLTLLFQSDQSAATKRSSSDMRRVGFNSEDSAAQPY